MPRSRRSLLACCAAGVASLAGCADIASVGWAGDESARQAGRATPYGIGGANASASARAFDETDLPVPRSAFVRGAARNAIPAIVEPSFGDDWSGVEMQASTRFGMEYTSKPRLAPDDRVVGVERGETARAYPLKLLRVHEVVNDTFEPQSKGRRTGSDGELGGPLLVTYCPLCGSAMTAVREVNGEPTVFGVSGLLYRNDLVMYDEATNSLWSQIAATAIRGPAVGTTLELVPSTLTTWGEWTDAHPETAVLRPPPESGTIGDAGPGNYDLYPYGGYRTDDRIGLAGSYQDDRLHPKVRVVGVERGDLAVAYPRPVVQAVGVVNDAVGDLLVVVATTDDGTLAAYSRRVDGETLTFERADGAHLRAGGSRWRITNGTAVDGPHEGHRLRAVGTSPMFFFAWKDFHPETVVYGVDRGPSTAGGRLTPTSP